MTRNVRYAFLLSAILAGTVFYVGQATYLCALEPLDSAPRTPAAQIFETAGVRGGLVVHLGAGDGGLTAALARNSRFLVQGLDADPENVAAARAHIRALGKYGPVSARHWNGPCLPYADNLVRLLVIGDGAEVDQAEITRVLAPRGVAVQLDAEDAVVETFRKPIPEDVDEWTHYLHDAGNNAVADDARIGPPRYLQWKGGPEWCRSHEFASSVQALVSGGGRLIGVFDEGLIGQPRGVPALWTLIARDAYSGVLLWRKPCDQIEPHALVVAGDRVYVTLEKNGPLCILDAATGETLRVCEETRRVTQIALCEGRLLLAAQLTGKQGGPHVLALDPDSGAILWKTPAEAILKNTMVAGAGKVCFASDKELVCLDLTDGAELWKTTLEKSRVGYAVLYGGAVFLTGGSTRAFSLEDGDLLWTGPDGSPHARNPPGLFGAQGMIWTAWGRVGGRSFVWQPEQEIREGYDPLTGEVRRTVTAQALVTPGHHIRCYPPKATERYLLLNKRGVEFFDLQGQDHMRANWTRAACGFGMLPANGYLYATPSQCFCYQGVLLTGMNALSASREELHDASPAGPQLRRGPAYGSVTLGTPGAEDAADWPTYRHDPRRSGSIDAALPRGLKPVWQVSLCRPALGPDASSDRVLRPYVDGGLTPPVAADGIVVAAVTDAHTVYALDADHGELLWSFVADGRVDSPPTLHRGLCIFGSTDGHVYCLSASDGRLVWRFRAAPEERQIGVASQLESAWPVHGSVLVRDGLVYFTAGRSSYLDGGMDVYALDPATGRIVHQTRLHDDEPDVSVDPGRPFDMDGAKTDILVAGEEDIYLFQNRFNADLTTEPMPRVTKLGDRWAEPHLMTNNGLLDRTWFNRTYWTYGDRWPGYYFTYRAPKSGQIVVFDDENTYALKAYIDRHGHSPEFRPGTGYQLMADRNTTQPVLDEMDIGAEKGRGFSRTELPIWLKRIPIRAYGMLLARDHLYVAGPPDLSPIEGAYEAMIGRRGSLLRVVSTSDGATLSEIEMDEVPVFDGLIAAGGRLYMATLDGTILCLGEDQ